jgi:hypothetical protein
MLNGSDTPRFCLPGRFSSRRGISLLEILGALLILGFAAVPVVGIMWTNAVDADQANASVFAQTAATNILNTTLDSIPFEVLQVAPGQVADPDGQNPAGNVGRLVGSSTASFANFLKLLGNPGKDTFTRGILTDERGVIYRVKLLVFPVSGYEVIDLEKELSFTFLPRPPYEHELDGRGQPNWYTRDKFVPREISRLPYDVSVATVTRNAKTLGIAPGPQGDFCIMKKLLLQIRWRTQKGPERSLDIVTAKGNLSREDIR